MSEARADRPPSIDRLARQLAPTGLPHSILVDIARRAVADGTWASIADVADEYRRSLLTTVVNATGVLLHTNLGRAPLAHTQTARPSTIEFDLATGGRGSRHRGVGQLLADLVGAEQAMVVNNNAAAVLLVGAALAHGRDVVVSRGESVEIGGEFRIPDVIAQSGARLVDVGTTNRTRRDDYATAVHSDATDVAFVLKVHPSNYHIDGFVESAPIDQLVSLGAPVVVDIGSGLVDATTPWLSGPPPNWLAGEPAAVQTLAAGAALVTFSADKLFGGPQAGVIAGRADLVERCIRHPLARALRCGGMVLSALNDVTLSYLHGTAATDVAFWRMASTPVSDLAQRAEHIIASAGVGTTVDSQALPGAGSAPGASIPSVAIAVPGDQLASLRRHEPPVVARAEAGVTLLDLRAVEPEDDTVLVSALSRL